MAKKVMVIGGTGNIGSAVTQRLLECGYRVSVFARREVSLPDCEVITGDRHDREAFVKKMREGRYDCAIDLAGFTREDAEDDAAAFADVQQMIFCSTGAVYGRLHASELPIRENYRAGELNWSYGVNKRAAEDTLMERYYASGFPVTVLRPSITYGRGNGLTRQLGGDNSWLGRIRRGLPILTGDPCIVRNFLHADDAARAFAGALEHDICIGQQYNLVGLHPRSWEEYHKAAMRALGTEVELVEMPLATLLALQNEEFQIGETILESFRYNGFYSGEKLARDIPEFQETIPLEKGMAMAIESLDRRGLIPEVTEPSYEDRLIALQKSIGVK